MEIVLVYLILGIIFLFLLAVGIGSNDAANSLGTPVGSKALKLKTALWLGSIFEILGVTTIGQFVSQTVRTGIIDPAFYGGQETVYALGMFSALVGATFWLFTASYLALPVSTTHSIVGGILGFGLYLNGGVGANTSKIGNIALSWVISPVSGFVVSYTLGKVIRRTILKYDVGKSNKKAIKYFPWHFSFTVSTMIIFIFESVLKSFDLGLELYVFLLIFVGSFILLFFFGKKWLLPKYLSRYKIDEDEDLDFIDDREAIEDILFQASNVQINEDLHYEDLTQKYLQGGDGDSDGDDDLEEDLHYINHPQYENMEMNHYQDTLPTIQDMTVDGSLSEELESTSILKKNNQNESKNKNKNKNKNKKGKNISDKESETSSQYKSGDQSSDSSQTQSGDTLDTDPTEPYNPENKNEDQIKNISESGLFLNVDQWVSYSDDSSRISNSNEENRKLMKSQGAKLDDMESHIKKHKKNVSSVPKKTKTKKKKKNYLKKKAKTTHPSSIPSPKRSWKKVKFADYRVHRPKSFRIIESIDNEVLEENKMLDLNLNLQQLHPTLEGRLSSSSSLDSSNGFDEHDLGFPLKEMDSKKGKGSSSSSETSSLIYSSSSDSSKYSTSNLSTENDNEGDGKKKRKTRNKLNIWKKKSKKKQRNKKDKENEKDLEDRRKKDEKKNKWKTLTLNDDVQYKKYKQFSNSKKLNPYDIEVKKLGNGMKLFLILQVFCSLFIAFGHGGNGLANSTAPLSSIIGIYQEGSATAPVSSNVYVLLGAGISASIGLMTIGKRVLLTVGHKITLLTPTGGYSAQLACALTTVIASRLGMPISTTHILIGSVMGIGVSRVGWKKGVNGKMIGRIILSWLVTLPIAGFTSLLLFSLMRPTAQNCS
ncbi:phosphate transporter [Anaeramoeba flamelloides]|uniref:Phosphate transporter n=1 Tax=Anaeramoeba flamelloides TaxID=1746091 RepID=A0ABQ8XCE2_9EUKA|nr:phosphate transporter [Anaeramoeba flamelloides]